MAGVNFTPKSTVISASWLQPMNDFFYNLFQGATTVAAARTALNITTPAVNTVAGTTYTLQASDADDYIVCTSNSPVTITVPSGVFTAPTTFVISQQGTGQVTIAADVGVTIRTASTLTTNAQYSSIGIIQSSANTWYAVGDLTPA